MEPVTSGSTAGLTVSWKDRNGNDATPSVATYSIRCVTTGRVVRASTPLPYLASSVEIELDETDNAMQGPANVIERKKLTVLARFATGEQTNADYNYSLRNVA